MLKDKGWENGLLVGVSQQECIDYVIGMVCDQVVVQCQYQGSLVKVGVGSLVLSGDSIYCGLILVDGGLFSVDGLLLFVVEVNVGGIFGGSGRIGGLLVCFGGMVVVGNFIGILEVVGDLCFEFGLIYVVEFLESVSDWIVVSGKVSIVGGNVILVMENSFDLFSQFQVESLVGCCYDIFDVVGGIDGCFDVVLLNYLFFGGILDYVVNVICLDIGCNGMIFVSVVQMFNQVVVVGVVEMFGVGNLVYESLFLLENVVIV